MFCERCGAALPDDSNFCPNCGMPVDGTNGGSSRERDTMRSHRRGFSFYLAIFLLLVFWAFFALSFRDKLYHSAGIAALQITLCLVCILMGFRTIKVGGRGLRALLVIIAVVLIVPFGNTHSAELDRAEERQKEEELRANPLVWPNNGLAQLLPAPETTMGEIELNYDDTFYFSMYYVSKEEYDAYVQRCVEKGFTIEVENWDTSYSAYNEDGYKIRIYYWDYSIPSISVSLDAPIELKTVIWPDTDMVNLLPKPESKLGSVETENASHFAVYIGNTTPEQFERYVNKCIAAGFDTDYSKYDTYYYGDYAKDYRLRVEYIGFNTIEVDIEAIK